MSSQKKQTDKMTSKTREKKEDITRTQEKRNKPEENKCSRQLSIFRPKMIKFPSGLLSHQID